MIVGRSAGGCLCCGNPDLDFEPSIVSGFLAQRAWGSPPLPTRLARCDRCGFRFFDHALTDAEAERYYAGYRDAEYVRERHRWEPFYTRHQHALVIEWANLEIRLEALAAVLKNAGLDHPFGLALDHGGDRGQMLRRIRADVKVVVDPSGTAPLEGIQSAIQDSDVPGKADLLLNCQVLEHVADPIRFLRKLGGLMADTGHLYVEVPRETWRLSTRPASASFLRWLSGMRHLLVAADTVSTAWRVKFGMLPPFGFVAMREHVNYFTERALSSAIIAAGYEIVTAGTNGAGQLYAVATRLAPPAGAGTGPKHIAEAETCGGMINSTLREGRYHP